MGLHGEGPGQGEGAMLQGRGIREQQREDPRGGAASEAYLKPPGTVPGPVTAKAQLRHWPAAVQRAGFL